MFDKIENKLYTFRGWLNLHPAVLLCLNLAAGRNQITATNTLIFQIIEDLWN